MLQVEGDRQAHELLAGELAAVRPGDAVLSEEGADDPARLDAERVWVVDPLDGTREFSEPGRTDWAVHVALVVGERPVAGAVALPALGVTLSTAEPPRLPPAHDGPPRLVVSRSRPPRQAETVADALGAVVVPLGSAGAKAMAVVRGDADLYVHAGGQYEWDSCAPAAVAIAAGCAVTRLDGSDLRYNQPDPYPPRPNGLPPRARRRRARRSAGVSKVIASLLYLFSGLGKRTFLVGHRGERLRTRLGQRAGRASLGRVTR